MNPIAPTRNSLFGRDNERAAIRQKLSARQPFLLHGPAGIGKSSLLRTLLDDFPGLLYTADTKSPQSLFRALGDVLIHAGDGTAKALLKHAPVSSKSAISLKGIVLDSLRASSYCVVLDQLIRPSQALASAVREMMAASASVVSVARSAHMEDAGYILPLYPYREERFEVLPFDSRVAAAFASSIADRLGITAGNREEFLARVLEYGKGNPGVILALLRKGSEPKYRTGNHIKIAPLYIDFRLEWNALA